MPSLSTPAASDDEDLLKRLREGDQLIVDQMYYRYANDFIEWARKEYPRLSRDQLEEAFHEAIVILYENIARGRLTKLRASLRTYLFGVGQRLCKNFSRKLSRTINVWAPFAINRKEDSDMLANLPVDLDYLTDDPFGLMTEPDEDELRYEQIETAMKHLSPDCRELLQRFYYDMLPLEALAEVSGHANAGVTRVRKSICLGRLRELCRWQ